MQGQNIFFGEFIGLGTVGAIHIRVSGHASFHPANILCARAMQQHLLCV
jgi:hypothetical protein